ncbi:MAG: AMP-binding protein [Oscillospiraceae bacterium]|jgi:long-chain acyl-CoA synthetase|nr:AMP-binding protein [Oscillospiraceae bacterium]
MDYPDVTISGLLRETAAKYPKLTACEFLGFRRSYARLVSGVRHCAGALRRAGIGAGDRVLLALPNLPQTVLLFYALNEIGAVSVFVHPLSAPEEVAYYIESSRAAAAVTLHRLYAPLESALSGLRFVLLTEPEDGLPGAAAAAARLVSRRRVPGGGVTDWRRFLAGAKPQAGAPNAGGSGDCASILFSGGTSGMPKGIIITNGNFNALALGTAEAAGNLVPGEKMLSVMPMFHGFGLGICIHTSLAAGLHCILVPQFTVKSYLKTVARRRPNYIAGVPTLFEALLRLPDTEKIDLSQLSGVFSGGDAIPPELKRRVDAFLAARGSKVRVREGYGLTETVTACCLTPRGGAPEGSIGKPYPDTLFKIVAPETTDELAPGEVGEICVSGVLVTPGYDGDGEETAAALRLHGDGVVWLHTGDLGSVDADGFVYFRGRLKRVVVTSGYNVYPQQVERVLDAHEFVRASCVVGAYDDYKMQRVAAYIVREPTAPGEDVVESALRDRCRAALAPHSRPREYRFIDELPRTKLGKVDYRKLEG